LWNPSIRESIVLPNPKTPLAGSICCLGLGYDSTSGDYKILQIDSNVRGLRASSQILALKSEKDILLFSFSISNEVYGEMPLPEQVLHSTLNYGVSVMEGLLCVYSTIHLPVEGRFTLWIMKDYGVKESWNVTAKRVILCNGQFGVIASLP
ncbi:putative F-box protein At3g47150, partial [Solanum dulcamara]|uniref:putative F-box protein At3g47150 n=1 Tax=Solanum dulcamara TaxID=45834 RepID=UPI002485E10A